MKYNITINKSSFGKGDGAIEIANNEFVLYKKSNAVRTFGGALGVALAGGKEVLRFGAYDIRSYEVKKKTFSKLLNITLNDGNYVEFKLKSDVEAEILPIIKAAVDQI